MSTIYATGTPTRVIRPSIAHPGMFLNTVMTIEGINLADEAAQILTLTLTAATGATQYSVNVNGINVNFKTPGTITMLQLQSLLLDKLEVNPEISGIFSIAASGADSVLLTAATRGIAYPFAGSNLIIATQTQMPFTASDLDFGRVVTARKKFIDKLPVCGVPTATAQKALGITQRSHGGYHDYDGLASSVGLARGEVVSLVTQGQGWLEFESVADMAIDGSLFYRAVPSAAQMETGKLVYAISAPAGFVQFPGTLNSETSTIADGRVVGLTTFSLV
jgi:hypothetical protein